ncbi:MAG TPA: aldose epimerase family protein [Candidatus Saccharicenans sp.]|nr:aldose epimerase family protein [Candidatus Saccharicenans sp.]
MVIQEKISEDYQGQSVRFFQLENDEGLKAILMSYGATLVSLYVPDRQGKIGDVVLGFDSLSGYLGPNPYIGATIGRYANRIAGGRFVLDGREYQLAKNDGPNHLHGGIRGFDKVVWQAEPFTQPSGVGVRFSYLSPDGEEGYPGNLSCQVTYLLANDCQLEISYQATTDRPTHLNLTNHSYFNLSAGTKDNILDHELQILASAFTPVDETLIPTGEIKPVAGTPFDFRQPVRIGKRIDQVPGGYDHNFVLDNKGELAVVARVFEPDSGRKLELLTTEPGLQFYSGNFLDGTIRGKAGKTYGPRSAFCLESQHFPDSPNQPHFPSTILRPGEVFRSRTIFRFSTH